MRQVVRPPYNGQRNHGRLPKNASLQHNARFHSSELTAGRTFEANLAALGKAVHEWEQCCSAFTETVQRHQITAAVQDGTGPVAHVLRQQFNHRLGGAAGVVYAVDMYQQRLLQLLDGLTATAMNLAQAEEHAVEVLREAATS